MIQFLDRPIAYHRSFVELGVGVVGALMLSQAIYWSKRTNDKSGWFYKTQSDWEEETGLGRSEQEKARRALKSIGVLEEMRKGIPAKLYFKINTVKLESLLLGTLEPVVLETVLMNYGSTLNGLSKTGLMRAKKLGAKAEFVDYCEVLKSHGMKCGICGEQIKLGPSRHREGLSFDHKKPLSCGGEHSFENLQPAHTYCNSAKSGNDDYVSNSSMSSVDKQDGLPEANSTALGKQTNTENTQRLPETTTDIAAKAVKQKKRKCRLPDDFKPTQQHYQMAKDKGVDLDHELQQFKDYHTAKGSMMVDWHAALRTWIRNAAKFQASSGKNKTKPYMRGEKMDYAKGVNPDGTF